MIWFLFFYWLFMAMLVAASTNKSAPSGISFVNGLLWPITLPLGLVKGLAQ